MLDVVLILVLGGLVVLLIYWLRGSGCDHELVYYAETGERMDEVEWGEPCFSKCRKCGEISVIPGGFQSHASFESFLSSRELGGSHALREVARDQVRREGSSD